ncbi:uncharacterized protein LOC119346511 isoform X1 [Triticum dicoccoides]|uniref:uncharacterized protein LOC119346511 isoform X1 n=1 Tax=Triticum dicoccoides TaxID=85692 RepID=UPI00188FFC5D|nr:uncharacterized protein LOC119346511 isoform X1 [Triticum dicoccoides]
MVSMAAAKIAVLLAATTLFAAAGAADPQPPLPGNETQCWQCYSTCMHKCDNSSCGDVQKYFQCKKSCILDCYKELPPVCFKMCISQTCLTLPPGGLLQGMSDQMFPQPPVPRAKPGSKATNAARTSEADATARTSEAHATAAVAQAAQANPAKGQLIGRRQSRCRRARH